MTEIDTYSDAIIDLARDPDLVRDSAKEKQLIRLIRDLTERNLSKLCNCCTAQLRALEKISLRLKGWEFLSLNYNSDGYFDSHNAHMREFNDSLAEKVMLSCQECSKIIGAVSAELDRISLASRNLTPIEYVSDGGTLLMSLLLRNINLKNSLAEFLTVSYLKAKLILIGKELESMLDMGESDSTLLTYKSFISNLLKQLDSAVEQQDHDAKRECLAVVSDMERMFDAYKEDKQREAEAKAQVEYENERVEYEREKAAWLRAKQKELALKLYFVEEEQEEEEDVQYHGVTSLPELFDDVEKYEDLITNSEVTSVMSSSYTGHVPLIQSITRTTATTTTTTATNTYEKGHGRRPSSTESITSSSVLHKTTILEELPYLMTAFSSAKNIQRDISHFKQQQVPEPSSSQALATSNTPAKVPARTLAFGPKRSGSLYQETNIINPRLSAQLYANDSLLSRMGIRPQVIAAPLKSVASPTNRIAFPPLCSPNFDTPTGDDSDKENSAEEHAPLTQANLESHTLSKMVIESEPDTVD